MMTNLRIRPVAAGDWTQLELLVAGICRYHGDSPALTRETFSDLALRENAPITVLVAETEDGILAGFAAGFPRFDFPQGKSIFEIQNLFVAEAFRRQRIGEVLMIGMMQTARRQFGDVPLSLGARKWNTEAISFYKQLGFVPNEKAADSLRLVRAPG